MSSIKPAGADITRPAAVAADATCRLLRVPPEYHGKRLDVFLSLVLRNTSRTRARQIAERGAYDRSGRPLRPNDRLQAEREVLLWRDPIDEAPSDLELSVLHRDEHLLAIDKPAHVAVHPTARHYHATVTKLLEQRFPGQHFSLLHRLDRETSGVLLIARSKVADRAFKRLFASKTRSLAGNPQQQPAIEKTYVAIAKGELAAERFTDGVNPWFVIDDPLEPDPTNRLRVKMRVADRESASALACRTRARVLASKAGYSLIACKLVTGRQHQIRVHLRSIGHPVVGDKLYGEDDCMLARAADGTLSERDLERLELPRHALHAYSYGLNHPLIGTRLDIRAAIPAELRDFWFSKTAEPLPPWLDPKI